MYHLYPAAGQLIPAGNDRFGHYAQHLKFLLQVPLHEARGQLAELYGFSSQHEIRQVMKVGLTAGPFSAEPPIPSFFNEELPGFSGPDYVMPDDPLYRASVERTWSLIHQAQDDEWTNARQMAIVEAGFFCAPKVHGHLFARVQRGLAAFALKTADGRLSVRP